MRTALLLAALALPLACATGCAPAPTDGPWPTWTVDSAGGASDAGEASDGLSCASQELDGRGCYVEPGACVEDCGRWYRCLHGAWARVTDTSCPAR